MDHDLAVKLAAIPSLRDKLNLHRGFHQVKNDDWTTTRPIENTREAYKQAAKLNARYAECDIWSSADNQLFLCHNNTVEAYCAEPLPEHAKQEVSKLSWDILKSTKSVSYQAFHILRNPFHFLMK
eukprot:m.219550 g.219550  ORF g.219550 m.219550 type:complete len:125 (-) comp15915_c0_seq7:28-402(-)